MDERLLLQDYLKRHAGSDTRRQAVAEVVACLATTAIYVAETVSLGALSGIERKPRGRNANGDMQNDLDVWTDRRFRDALCTCPAVSALASEEMEEVEIWDAARPFAVAIDPIDGSSNVDVNMPVGTIFSIVPTPDGFAGGDTRDLAWPRGTEQAAAGFIVYGPQTSLVLTLGETVDVFTLDRRNLIFRLTRTGIRMAGGAHAEYAINASNYRHWEEPVRTYIDEYLAGAEGPHGRDFNMRWHGALVADAYRVLTRGGIYLYPADARAGYGQGRLRLVYEANPMALLIERAGGSASNGRSRILDLVPRVLHQRVPLILGPIEQVERLEALHNRPGLWPQTASPLFATRGLFRV
ncbi:Fructose-1,6-bisphosphatase class 1 [Labrys miyagiensis]